MKFIHLANVFLGTGPLENSRFTIDRTTEYYADFLKVLDVCKEEKIDALFITGNLFDHVPAEEELQDLDDRFMELPDTRVFLLTGEKDAPESAETAKKYSWRSNTTVFAGDCIERVYVSKLNTEITGIGYSEKTWERVKTESLTRGRKGTVQVLLLPFMGSGRTAELPEYEGGLPFDYIGIGQERFFKGRGREKIYSPGLFEPEGFSQQLTHGYFTGELNPELRGTPGLSIRFEQGAKREYMTLKVNAAEEISYVEAEQRIRSAIDKYGKDNIYRILLTGKASASLCLMRDKLYELGLVAEIQDEMDREDAMEHMKGSATGDALSRFLGAPIDEEDAKIRKKALEYGVNALFAVQDERNK